MKIAKTHNSKQSIDIMPENCIFIADSSVVFEFAFKRDNLLFIFLCREGLATKMPEFSSPDFMTERYCFSMAGFFWELILADCSAVLTGLF